MKNLPRIRWIALGVGIVFVGVLIWTVFDVALALSQIVTRVIATAAAILAIVKVVTEFVRGIDANDPMIAGEEYHTQGRGVTLPAFWRRVL